MKKNQLHLAHGRQKTRKVTEKLKQFQHDLQESNLSKQMLEFTLTNKLQENEITLLTEQNLRLQLQYHLEKFKRNDRDKEWLLKKKDNELSLLRLTLKEETNKLLFSEKQLLEQTKRKKEMEEEYSLLKISNRELNTVVERMYSDSENLIERMRDYEQAYSQHVKKVTCVATHQKQLCFKFTRVTETQYVSTYKRGISNVKNKFNNMAEDMVCSQRI